MTASLAKDRFDAGDEGVEPLIGNIGLQCPGKTTAVVNILKCLIENDPEAIIQLAAPTGKAASRMKEAVANNVSRIEEKGIQEKLMGLEAKTLHRLLYTPGADGSTPSRP